MKERFDDPLSPFKDKPLMMAIIKSGMHTHMFGCELAFSTSGDPVAGYESVWECPNHGAVARVRLSWDRALNDIKTENITP